MTTSASEFSFLAFLKQSAAHFQSANTSTPLHFVIGNEAGDADSIVSALTYAYVASSTTATATDSSSMMMIPIVSIPRDDLLTQRPETVLLLERAGLSKQDLEEHIVFVDDLAKKGGVGHQDQTATEAAATTTTRKVTLMDHNALSETVGKQMAGETKSKLQVVEIWDHHLDLQLHLDTCPVGDQRNIAFDNGGALVASTCTLVAEELLRKAAATKSSTTTALLSPPLALLLLGTIVLDSVNMSPKAGKGTERDAQAMKALLESVAEWNSAEQSSKWPRPDPEELFQALQNAKFDPQFWNALSVRNALRLDYKGFAVVSSSSSKEMTLGISTVLLPWSDFCQKPKLAQQVEAYMEELDLPIMAVMMTSTTPDGQFQRELFLAARNDDALEQRQQQQVLLDSLVNVLQTPQSNEEGAVDLQLSEQSVAIPTGSLHVRFFCQGNAKASRKLVAPILMQHLAKLI